MLRRTDDGESYDEGAGDHCGRKPTGQSAQAIQRFIQVAVAELDFEIAAVETCGQTADLPGER